MFKIPKTEWILESREGGLIVNVFDFDNTLFKSPVPNPNLWNPKFIGKLKAEVKEGGLGWYQSLLTLSPQYIDPDAFIDSTVDAVKESMSNPNAITVLLTGRTVAYTDLVKALVDRKGLVFDYMGLKPFGLRTLPFKYDFIRNVINEASKNGNISKVNIYEDRAEHVDKFKQFLTQMDIPNEIHFVKGGDYHMPEEKERELVEDLKIDYERAHGRKFNIPGERVPSYYGVILSEESRNKLLTTIGVPEGWKAIAHHVTIVPPAEVSKPSDALTFAKGNLDKEVSVKVIAVGKSDKAMAVMVSGIPSTNKNPHITVSVSPDGKPKDSNDIQNWDEIEEFELSGIVKASY